jgi:hypothetical protein
MMGQGDELGDPPATPLVLPNVTLVAASSIAIPQTVRAMQACLAGVTFGEAILFTHDVAAAKDEPGIRVVAVEEMRNRADYSRFMLRSLGRFIETDFALCVQWDGYVLDPSAWRAEFLDYDYIGAPWPHFHDAYVVGNGGFSMRSKRLLAACADPRVGEELHAEDIAICRAARPLLETEYGIRFAPVELARRFAFERGRRRGDEFGFHGVFNMIDLMDPRAFCGLLSAVGLGNVGDREQNDLYRQSLRRLDMRLNLAILRHWFTKWLGIRGAN